jgi:hypothetical protein
VRHKPVGKRSRALGIALTPKAEKILDERPSRPGQHGTSRHLLPEYGRRLREKQRLPEQYFISETARSHAMPVFAAAREEPAVAVPAYPDVRRDLLAVHVMRPACREEVPVTCDEQLVIEYYAR